jgi:hypothetical protein
MNAEMRQHLSSGLTARGESVASHRDGRGASRARRDDREYREYLREEQRSPRGCIARRMQPDFHHGRLSLRRLSRQRVGAAGGRREQARQLSRDDGDERLNAFRSFAARTNFSR